MQYSQLPTHERERINHMIDEGFTSGDFTVDDPANVDNLLWGWWENSNNGLILNLKEGKNVKFG